MTKSDLIDHVADTTQSTIEDDDEAAEVMKKIG